MNLRIEYQPRNDKMRLARVMIALKKSWGLAGVLTALSPPVFANDSAPNCPPMPTAPETAKIQEIAKSAKDRGFLWKIEKQGRTSFLYGTIHINSLEWAIPGPKTMAALRESEMVALEINLFEPEVREAMSNPVKLATNSQTLNETLKLRLDAQLKRTCAPLEFFAKQPPMMQIAGAIAFDARFLGLEAAYGSEVFLIGLAQGVKKPLVGLESAAVQLNAIVGNDTSNEVFESALAQLESGKARRMLSRLHAAWGASKDADIENLQSWCECLDSDADRKYMRQLNDDRNPGLAKGIDKLHGEGKRVFAAVGSLHMFGDKALPKLLREMGYTVERVKF
jgi:uncharacterized protein